MMNCRQSGVVSLVRSGWVRLHSVHSLLVQPDWQAHKRWLALRSVAQSVSAFRSTKIGIARRQTSS